MRRQVSKEVHGRPNDRRLKHFGGGGVVPLRYSLAEVILRHWRTMPQPLRSLVFVREADQPGGRPAGREERGSSAFEELGEKETTLPSPTA